CARDYGWGDVGVDYFDYW
nr:immunoglobulin heavy chain junction region [Macaca mulatta]